MSSRATLIEVAKLAGASLASTSRALHGSGASPEMVARVKAAADELGYRPNVTGRSLRMKKSFQVAFVVADIGNPVYVEMLSAIEATLAPHGFRIVVSSTGDDVASAVDVVTRLDDGLVDGLIISPLRITDDFLEAVREASIPIVAIGRPLQDHGIDSVSTDSARGIADVVSHLVATGRRRIAFLNGPLDTTPGSARQRGWDAATTAADFVGSGLATEVAEDFTVSAGVTAAHRLLERLGPDGSPDAIVAANDLLAIGVVRAATERGLRVPEDLAVTGMDDTEIGRVFQPTLTSVSLQTARRGELAAELMLARLRESEREPQHVTVGPELRARESSKEVS